MNKITICSDLSQYTAYLFTCIFLKRYAYPILFGDMVPRFGRSARQLSMIASEMSNLVYNLHHLFEYFPPGMVGTCSA